MSDLITITGIVGGDPRPFTTSQGLVITTFRLASTRRYFDRASGSWENGETNWYTVSTFRTLADNVAASIRRGQHVVVHGRLKLRAWQAGRRAARPSRSRPRPSATTCPGASRRCAASSRLRVPRRPTRPPTSRATRAARVSVESAATAPRTGRMTRPEARTTPISSRPHPCSTSRTTARSPSTTRRRSPSSGRSPSPARIAEKPPHAVRPAGAHRIDSAPGGRLRRKGIHASAARHHRDPGERRDRVPDRPRPGRVHGRVGRTDADPHRCGGRSAHAVELHRTR
ncbi:single-stranded DNA-binding protein [Agromyces sp. MMS24-K17]|uniref:single-stranded DNA-binding protein n=1 Tax=Agromyces sp. MMS24-K17 TaxID=3372850 RepID=UPI0037543285